MPNLKCLSYPCVHVLLESFCCGSLETKPRQVMFICRSAAMIGRQLAVVGDDINSRYTTEFSQMIRMLHLTPETAYEAFAGVARKYVVLSR